MELERRGGCCIAMYGGDGDAKAAWRMGRIMLRFRPIAPKPAAGSRAITAPVEAPPALARRHKRKGSGSPAAGARARKACKAEAPPSMSKGDGKTSASSSSSSKTTAVSSTTIVTLPLMPEIPERKEEPTMAVSEKSAMPAWMGTGVVVAPRPVRAVGSWVTVECVTDTWKEGEVPWRSDEAVMAALAADECPGFVSDEVGRVTRTNEAYRRMVLGAGEPSSSAEGEEEMRVGLVGMGLVPAKWTCRAFTCRVRVRYLKRTDSSKGFSSSTSLTAPCDVWRLDRGGAAWRLDMKAALSLSL